MASRAGLRAVPTKTTPATRSRRKPRTVADAAASGSHLGLLVAMRERIARTVS